MAQNVQIGRGEVTEYCPRSKINYSITQLIDRAGCQDTNHVVPTVRHGQHGFRRNLHSAFLFLDPRNGASPHVVSALW